MSMEKIENKIPVIKGWFDMEKKHLIGNRCPSCGEFFFPKAYICRNPECDSENLDETPISTKGIVWSHTLNHYEPPAPYIPIKKFEPYAILVVELLKEKLMILGPLADGCDYEKIAIGTDVEMVFEILQRDRNGNDVVVWKWRPINQAG